MSENSRPLVSVVMPAYNYAHTLRAAMDSVLGQGLDSLELIIMDDASTDDTPVIAGEYAADPRVRYVRQTANLGAVRNSNCGLRLANGHFIMILAADDLLMPHYFQTVLGVKQRHPEAGAIATAIYCFKTPDEGFWPRPGLINIAYCGGRDEFAGMLAHGCYMFFGSILAERKLYEAYGLLDERIGAGTDLELVIRWARNDVVFAYVPEHLVAFREHAGQLSGKQNYEANGLLLSEFLAIAERNINAQTSLRLHGHEHAIMRHVQHKVDIVESAGFVIDEAVRARIDALEAVLTAGRAAGCSRVAETRFAVLMLDDGELPDLESSVSSLLAQSDPQWELLIATDRPQLDDAYTARLDPAGRIRLVKVDETDSQGQKLNALLRISGADAFGFLHAGSCFEPDHVKVVRGALQAGDAEIIVVTPILEIVVDGERQLVPGVYLPIDRVGDAVIADIIPLDVLTVRRRVLDKYFIFNNDLQIMAAWELFLRFRAAEVVSLAPQLQVSIALNPSVLRTLPHRDKILPLIDILYSFYPRAGEEARLRAAYRGQVACVLEHWDRLCASEVGLIQIMRTLHGTEVLMPVAA
jgi:GT2 family glycosyltransferase